MIPSPAAFDLIRQTTPFRPMAHRSGRGKTYKIGWGHDTDDPDAIVTYSMATELLLDDVNRAYVAVNVHVKVELTQAEFDALVSLVADVGELEFAESQLLRLLNGGDRAAAADALEAFGEHHGQRRALHVIERRRAERRLFDQLPGSVS